MNSSPKSHTTLLSAENHVLTQRTSSEQGGARLNLLIVLFLITVAGYGVANSLPVYYQTLEYKDVMQSKVDQAAAYGHTGEWVSTQLRAEAIDYGVPPDAVITTNQRDGRVEAAVKYSRPIPLPGYIYNYKFDHTARSSTFFKH